MPRPPVRYCAPKWKSLISPFLANTKNNIKVNGENVNIYEYDNEALTDEDAAHVQPDGSGYSRIDETGKRTIELLDLDTDRYDTDRKYSFSTETIVLFEGVFLFRKELAKYIDLKLFLEIPFSESKKRALERDPEAILNKYDAKYLPAQEKYLKEYPPTTTADIIVDNTVWEFPRIK